MPFFWLQDIQSALRWVKNEIEAFGGDPETVAIHGQSSGGGLVELQYVAPASNHLFRTAISESGGLGASSLNDSLANTVAMATVVGCDPTHNLKACMKALPPLVITNLTNFGEWGPTTDGVTFPEDPMSMLASGKVNNCSVILGAQVGFLSPFFSLLRVFLAPLVFCVFVYLFFHHNRPCRARC